MLRALTCSTLVMVPAIGGAAPQPPGRAPTLVVKFAGELPGDLVVGDRYVYWTEAKTDHGQLQRVRVLRAPKTGGAPVRMAEFDAEVDGPVTLASDGRDLYAASTGHAVRGGRILRLRESGPPEVLATGQHNPVSLLAGGGELYWTVEEQGGAIRRLQLRPGAAPATVADHEGEFGLTLLALDGEGVYFQGEDFCIWKLPRSGGKKLRIGKVGEGETVTALVLGPDVAVTNGGPDLWRFPRRGGKAERLDVPAGGGMLGVALGAELCWFGQWQVGCTPFAGGKSRTVFALPAAEREEHAIRGLAGDAAHLYWLHEEKGVERLAL